MQLRDVFEKGLLVFEGERLVRDKIVNVLAVLGRADATPGTHGTRKRGNGEE